MPTLVDSPTESSLFDAAPTTWPDGSPKPGAVVADEAWLSDYAELEIVADCNPDHAGLQRGVKENAAEAEVRGARLLKAHQDQRLAEARAAGNTHWVECLLYWRDCRRRRQSGTSPIVLRPLTAGRASGRESRGSSTRTRGSRRTSPSSSDDPGGSSEPGEAGQHAACSRPGCAEPMPSYRGKGRPPKFCTSSACRRARAADRQRESRAKLRPPRGMFRTLDGELHGQPGGGQLPWDGPTTSESRLDLRNEPARQKALDDIADLWLDGQQADAAELLRSLRDEGVSL